MCRRSRQLPACYGDGRAHQRPSPQLLLSQLLSSLFVVVATLGVCYGPLQPVSAQGLPVVLTFYLGPALEPLAPVVAAAFNYYDSAVPSLGDNIDFAVNDSSTLHPSIVPTSDLCIIPVVSGSIIVNGIGALEAEGGR